MAKYWVIVGNIGIVDATDNVAAAEEEFNYWVRGSNMTFGRASGESVTLFEDGKPIAEHGGSLSFPVLDL